MDRWKEGVGEVCQAMRLRMTKETGQVHRPVKAPFKDLAWIAINDHSADSSSGRKLIHFMNWIAMWP